MNYELTFEAIPIHHFRNRRIEDFESLDSEAFVSTDVEKYVYNGGWFVNKGYLQWEEWQKEKSVLRFAEAKRDDGYIYLYDLSRNIWVALPIDGGRSYYAYGGSSNWTDLYDVRKVPKSSTGYGSPAFRARAIQLLEPLPPYPQEITSNGQKRNIFTQMTGLTHEQLVANWATEACRIQHKCITSCNAFTGWFSKAMGSKTYLGRFDLDTFARRAWVPASSGAIPKHGDILRFNAGLHVGIALDLVDGILNTAEGGQGGPKRRFDAIKRKRIPWNPTQFKGWVDLESWILGGG